MNKTSLSLADNVVSVWCFDFHLYESIPTKILASLCKENLFWQHILNAECFVASKPWKDVC